ncbi:MAG: 50S ribosomal protein L9, partial [Actinomycetota bacterium]
KSTRAAKEHSGAERTKAKLESSALAVSAQTGPDGRLFGSVTASDVAGAIASQLGVDIDRHAIELAEPIKHLGVHTVRVKLHTDVVAQVRVDVSAAE